jgi:tetratricopeptide (TPR) repeat protein
MNDAVNPAATETRHGEAGGSNRRVAIEWAAGSLGVLLAVAAWGWIFHLQDHARAAWEKKAATNRPTAPARATPLPPSAVASHATCKPAWRLSLNSLRAFDAAEVRKDVQSLESLLAVADGAWEGAAAKAALEEARLAACAPDNRGAWALAIGPASQSAPPLPNRQCGDVVLDLVRIDERGAIIRSPLAMLEPDPDCHSNANAARDNIADAHLSTIADMNNDGIAEVLFEFDGATHYTSDIRNLFTSQYAQVKQYPGTAGLPLGEVRDQNNDGRPDVAYHYQIDGGYESSCGVPEPAEYSSPLVAFTRSDGVLQFNEAPSRDAARKLCPGPPRSAEGDVLCAKLWGFEARGLPNYRKLQAQCVKDYAAEDAKKVSEGGGCGLPSRDACSHFYVWQDLAETRFAMTLWPPPPWDEFTRSDSEEVELLAAKDALTVARHAIGAQRWDDAVAAYLRARAYDEPDVVASELAYAHLRAGDAATAAAELTPIVGRIADPRVHAAALYNLGLAHEALGDVRAASRAFARSLAVRETKEARLKLDGATVCPADVVTNESSPAQSEWTENAGEERAASDESQPDGDWYQSIASEDPRFVALTSYRYPGGAHRDAVYSLDSRTGRVRQCTIGQGCECVAGSPCMKGVAPGPSPAREVVVFSADGSRLVARVSWPGDADVRSGLAVRIAKGEVRVTGLGCNTAVRVAQ